MIKIDAVNNWLNEFKGKGTRRVYRSVLKKFQKFVDMDLNEYITQDRDFFKEFKAFISDLDAPPKSVSLYASVVKMFLKEQKVLELSEDEWRRIRKRQEIVNIPLTQDRAPTKAELRVILNCLSLKGRALVLFLASSGARIGETLQIKPEDIDLESDPPKTTIRSSTTKGKRGGRTVRMSYEARDAIRDWLTVKPSLLKKNGERFNDEFVFPFTSQTAINIWNRATRKVKLNQQDPETKRYILHIHSLRKFFRSNIGLDFDLTNALMGHYAYLDRSYRRLKEEDIDSAYLSAMKNVSVYSVPASRKEEVRRALAIQGLTVKEVLDAFRNEMYENGVGSGGGLGLKGPIDEDFILSLEDQQIGKYALKALRQKLLGNTSKSQKVITESELEEYLEKGWRYINSLNNGSHKCIITKS